ncbi:MAG: hypothetical protein ACKOA1_09250, partial [Bacteroidota bacterium]
RVQGTVTGRKSKGIDNLKHMAVLDALQKSKADVLVEPSFDISRVGRKVTVIATGFPATYSNFHSMKNDEVELFKNGDIRKADVYTKEEPRKGRSGPAVAISIGSAVAVLLLVLALF